jgi:hypothetical protein
MIASRTARRRLPASGTRCCGVWREGGGSTSVGVASASRLGAESSEVAGGISAGRLCRSCAKLAGVNIEASTARPRRLVAPSAMSSTTHRGRTPQAPSTVDVAAA